MFRSLSNSWELAKASAAVLRSDKELILFPIVSAIGSVLVLATFAAPMFVAGVFDQLIADGQVRPLGALVAFLFYLVQYTVIFFANTALVGAAMIRLQGGDPTIADGFRIASKRLGAILGYALISATVGVILRAISERLGFVGRIVIGLIGFAWHLATYLVVPVLAAEDIGPVDAIKRSSSLLKRTWGEQVVGNASIGAVFGLFMVGAIGVGALLITLGVVAKSTALIILAVIATIVAVLAIGLINATLSGIYNAAVYRYAAQGEISDGFNADMIQSAFRVKA
jgi:hypothetical protein